MRVAVLGAGAIGGWLAAGLARAGQEVGNLARGASLFALRREGLVLLEGEESEAFSVVETDDPAALAGPNLLVLGLKGQDLPGALPTSRRRLWPASTGLSACSR